MVVVKINGNNRAVERFDSTQAVVDVTNPVTDIVITTADKVENGPLTPVFEVLHIGERQTDRFFDLTGLVGTNGEHPNQTLRPHYGIGVAGQGYTTTIGVFFGVHHLEKMNGDSVCTTIRQFGVDRTGNFVGTGYVEGIADPLIGVVAFCVIGDENKGVCFFDETGLLEGFHPKEIRQLGMGNDFIGFYTKHKHLPFLLSHNQLLTVLIITNKLYQKWYSLVAIMLYTGCIHKKYLLCYSKKGSCWLLQEDFAL